MLDGMPGAAKKQSTSWKRGWMAGILILIPLLLAGFFWLRNDLSKPRQAPEAERVLSAQIELPFQVLIPAYLPKQFNRQRMEILTDQLGPNGEKMVRLIYSTRRGDTLTLSEWLPAEQDFGKSVGNVRRV